MDRFWAALAWTSSKTLPFWFSLVEKKSEAWQLIDKAHVLGTKQVISTNGVLNKNEMRLSM